MQRKVPIVLCIIFFTIAGNRSASARGMSQAEYISPSPGSLFNLPQTNIIVRSKDVLDKESLHGAIDAEGSVSGAHSGKTILSDDGKTIVFEPDTVFVSGEVVTVSLHEGIRTTNGDKCESLLFHFTVASVQQKISSEREMSSASIPNISPTMKNSGGSRPYSIVNDVFEQNPVLPDGFPNLKITTDTTTAPGYLFISNFPWTTGVVSTPYLLILDNSGNPIFYREMSVSCTDFKLQPNGHLTYFDRGVSVFYELDSSYQTVNSYTCGNGYTTDLHELRLLPNGHALLMAYDPQYVNMSGVVAGGKSNAIVTGLIIQELDQQKNVVFQWRSWDHFQITDATHEDLTAASIDYVHGNALEIDADGNLLLSSRHMDEVTKIDRQTGNIIWRMGGKHNQFTFVNDPIGFSHQHAVRRLPNGDVTLFDNGNYHTPQFSRAAEYTVDEQNKIATLVWQFRNSPDNYGEAMGYVQRLPNGNTLIGWGESYPSVTEVTPDGKKVFEMSLPDKVVSYRAYRFAWDVNGVTASAPANAGTSMIPGSIALNNNYPNPFNPSTNISFNLGSTGFATVKIYNLLGQEIATLANGVYTGGEVHTVRFNASNLPSGVYLYSLRSGGKSELKKMLLLK